MGTFISRIMQIKGFDCKIIDATAEGLSDKDVSKRLEDINPKFTLLVVYGQNPCRDYWDDWCYKNLRLYKEC